MNRTRLNSSAIRVNYKNIINETIGSSKKETKLVFCHINTLKNNIVQ